jgi:Uma2 family endonuclease
MPSTAVQQRTPLDVDPLVKRDEYRFGRGPKPVLQAGTTGWSVDDLKHPRVRYLWELGRYEIVEGVLTLMPAARFRGGEVVVNLQFIVRSYFLERRTRCACSTEVDVAVDAIRVPKVDGVIVIGEDLAKFEALRFDPPDSTWRDNALTLPPSILIESVSRGHEAHDRVTKRKWYADFKVPHYWIVDGFARTLECLRLEGGRYVSEASGKGEQTISVASFPGLKIPLSEVWGDRPAPRKRKRRSR